MHHNLFVVKKQEVSYDYNWLSSMIIKTKYFNVRYYFGKYNVEPEKIRIKTSSPYCFKTIKFMNV